MKITDEQLMSLLARLDREGQQLTVRALVRIHQILDDCLPEVRAEGTQAQLAELLRERMRREP